MSLGAIDRVNINRKPTLRDQLECRLIEKVDVNLGLLCGNDFFTHYRFILFHLFNLFLSELTIASPHAPLKLLLIVHRLLGGEDTKETLHLHVSTLNLLVLEELAHKLFILD